MINQLLGKSLLLWAMVWGAFFIYGQQSFEDYSALRSQGKIPEIFIQSTLDKVIEDAKVDRDDLSERQETEFLEKIHFGLDEMLQSGIVLYGDPATNYVQRVAEKLLEGAPKLKRQLQFYVIKSKVTNALSTDQGVIFVTLGLLAQVENEAQLAYVISHEIAHFQEEHVEKAYTESISIGRTTSYDDRIQKLSTHSKENELEADKLGIKLYHKAGYSEEELLGTFDVLMYSYLPFDEVRLPKTYFNNDYLYVPEKYFPLEINPILAEEDYDDEKSTHPNIRKRKTAIIKEIESYSNWGDKKFLLDESTFREVRTMARFESVRLSLSRCHYGDALYSIFLLERDFPNNKYLLRCKSQAWLGLASFKKNGSFSQVVDRPKDVEGESHAMHYFLREISKAQLLSISMRMIEDARKAYPNDSEIKKIHAKMIRFLADDSRFDVSDYRRINYETALERFEKSKQALIADTIEVADTVEVDDAKLSKYDKIKQKRDTEVAVTEDEEFDIEQFHLYALSDLVGEDSFKMTLREEQDRLDEEREKKEKLRNLSRRERDRLNEKERHLGIEQIVLIQPAFYSMYYEDDLPKESMETATLLIESIQKYALKLDMHVHDLTLIAQNELKTDGYNNRALLLNYIRQLIEYDDSDIFPVDDAYLGAISKEFNDSPILFAIGSHVKTQVTSRTVLTFLLLDMKEGTLKEIDTARFRKPKKFIIDGYTYEVLSKLKTKK